MNAGALTRTARLLQIDFFPSLCEEQIAAGLRSRRVDIRVAPGVAATRAGQSTIATAALLVSQLGVRVALEMDEAPLLARQPPFPAAAGLRASLLAGSRALIAPFAGGRHPEADLEIRIGELTAAAGVPRSIGASVTDWGCEFGTEVGGPCAGELPFGATLAAVALAAECLREAVAAIAADHDLTLPDQHDLRAPSACRLALPALELGRAPDLGRVDLLSAGAIANGALAVLLRVPGLAALLRVIDADLVELHNLNRCGLFTRDSVDRAKVEELAAYGDDRFVIIPHAARLTRETLADLSPLAPRLAVGVDHIPSRWLAQELGPGWLGVAGTSHFDVIASEHLPGMPCAGCLHPLDEEVEGPLPTISFVSALAGLLLAHRLLAAALGRPPAPPTYAWCLALHRPRGLTAIGLAADPRCPVGCEASRALAGPRDR